jgi:DHA3 family macrolide efflux protein-like MFS transporter
MVRKSLHRNHSQELISIKHLMVIWFGQVISMIGSGITAFAISVWVYQETGSVTLFAFNTFLQFLPGMVLSPLAGVLADRWSRRLIMILADSGAAASTLFVTLMFLSGNLALWQVYFATAANAIFNTFQGPAYAAAVSILVPKGHFTRASAMLQLGGQFSGLIAPTLAGFLLVGIGLPGIMLIDFTTFLFAISTLSLLRFPELSKPGDEQTQYSLLGKALQGWHYIAKRAGLRGLLTLSGINLFLIAVNATLSIPIILTLTSVEVVGVMALIFGSAGLLGSTVVTVWGGPKRHIYGVFGAHLMVGVGLILFGLRPNLILMTLAGFGIASILPLRDSTTEAIWRSKVPLNLQGRVFALLQVVSSTSFGLAYLLTGPLADTVFEPLMAVEGPLAKSVGQMVGTGAGRGMALCVVLAGILTLVVTAVAFLNRRVRLIEDELPDIQKTSFGITRKVFTNESP